MPISDCCKRISQCCGGVAAAVRGAANWGRVRANLPRVNGVVEFEGSGEPNFPVTFTSEVATPPRAAQPGKEDSVSDLVSIHLPSDLAQLVVSYAKTTQVELACEDLVRKTYETASWPHIAEALRVKELVLWAERQPGLDLTVYALLKAVRNVYFPWKSRWCTECPITTLEDLLIVLPALHSGDAEFAIAAVSTLARQAGAEFENPQDEKYVLSMKNPQQPIDPIQWARLEQAFYRIEGLVSDRHSANHFSVDYGSYRAQLESISLDIDPHQLTRGEIERVRFKVDDGDWTWLPGLKDAVHAAVESLDANVVTIHA